MVAERLHVRKPVDRSSLGTHLVVSDIRIYADEATITGPKLALFDAALKQTRATAPAVPMTVDFSVLLQGNRFWLLRASVGGVRQLNPQKMSKPLRFIENRQNVGR